MKDYITRTIKRPNKRSNKHKSKRNKEHTYTYEYRDKSGKRLSQRATKESLEGLYLPPALDDVKINLQKNAKVLAIGKDEKGRSQYTYNAKHTEKRSKEKFKHMASLGESYQKILRQIQRDLYTDSDSKDKQIATILRFVIDCSFRVGNEKYTKDNNSYGVTTLESRHVRTNGPKITVEFVGKKGVVNKCQFSNKKLSKNLRNRKRTLKSTDKLFTYRKGTKYYSVRPSDVNRYLRKFGNFTTKNFRTWTANLEFLHQLTKHPEIFECSETQRKRLVNECIDKVAHKLHNTRGVCKSNYLDPKLVDAATHNPHTLKDFRNCTTREEFTETYMKFLK